MKKYLYISIIITIISMFVSLSAVKPEPRLDKPFISAPLVTWNTFQGSSDDEYNGDIAVDDNGNVYVTGASKATWGSPVNPFAGEEDIYVAKLDSNGNLIWHTFFGSVSDDEFGYGIEVDAGGNVYISGGSYASWGTPLNPHSGGEDAFVAKLNSSGVLQWNTFLGSANNDVSLNIALGGSGNLYISGVSTDSWGTPVNPYNGDNDAYAAKLDNNGALLWNTFMGCPCNDTGSDIQVDSSGNLFIAGNSETSWGSPVNPHSGYDDAYAAKLNNNGVLQWNTFMGSLDGDWVWSLDIDSSGNIYISGDSYGTWGSPVNGFTLEEDAFVVKLNSSGALQWNTFLGGNDDDSGYRVVVDSAGLVYVSGRSKEGWGSPVESYTGSRDAYVAQLDNSGTLLKHAFLGSLLDDWGGSLAVDANRNIYLAGDSKASWGSPVNPFNALYERDTMVVKMLFTPITISGNAGIANATLSYNDGSSQSVLADGSGNYSFDVPYNWSGTVTPSLSGYIFSPNERTYSNLTVSQANQDYAVKFTPTISGTVRTAEGAAIQGVTLTFSDGGGTTTTDSNGEYSYTVSNGWFGSGTVTPSMSGMLFTPASRTYYSGTSIHSNQDYTGVSGNPIISGTIRTTEGAAIQGVTLTFSNGGGTTSTDTNGDYSQVVSYNWSGTVTPSSAGILFTPASRSYTTVVSSHTGQDYTAVSSQPIISGTVRTAEGVGIPGVRLNFSNGGGSTTTHANGNYSRVVPHSWSGNVTASLAGMLFTPASRSYTNVVSSLTGQDFTGIVNSPIISGTVWNIDSAGVANVTLSFSNGGGTTTTDENGEYSQSVSHNWSGTVTLSMTDYQFVPVERSYSKVVTHQTHNDFIALSTAIAPQIVLNRNRLNFGKVLNGSGAQTGSQTLLINNTGGGMLQWSAVASVAWIILDSAGGSGNGILSVTVDASGLEQGIYTGTITVSDASASNTPQTVSVSLKVHAAGAEPFGTFSTPVENASVQGSVPFTGWALDDTAISSIKLYRLQDGAHHYIGDAVMVDGARPDVETAYSSFPNHFQAGWGYMMLTHFLPDGGNGTHTIIARATDQEGNTVSLGSRTITVDNASAVKPFGAIDSPEQGGIISGSHYINWGWALTPTPNIIPVDGSTIKVWVDGVSLGNPVYNNYRQDIADLFPGYQNSNGAVGYFTLDTTAYMNGVHTIQWTVTDSDGNTDGIGSRYFSIHNTDGVSRVKRHAQAVMADFDINKIAPDRMTVAASARRKEIEARELDAVTVDLGKANAGKIIAGYLRVGNQLQALPIGSTLKPLENKLYWQLGPGFAGKYRLLFIRKEDNKRFSKQEVTVTILPRHGQQK